MTEAYGEEAGEPNTSPWVWDAAGQHMAWMAIQAAGAPFYDLLQCVPTSWRRSLFCTIKSYRCLGFSLRQASSIGQVSGKGPLSVAACNQGSTVLMKVECTSRRCASPKPVACVPLRRRQSLIALLSASNYVALGIGEPVALDGQQPLKKRPSITPGFLSPKPRQFQTQTTY